jgi:regulator of RNase E activity RraA
LRDEAGIKGLEFYTWYPMNMHAQHLSRLADLDTNTVSDALDFLELPGATVGLRPLWNCPKIVGRASTIQLAPKRADSGHTVHPITSVIAESQGDDRILVIVGGIEGVSCWGDIVANAATMKHIRGTVIDGFSRDIAGSEEIGYPVYGRGVTMVSARNRLVQTASGEPVTISGVKIEQDDFVIADRCGTVFVPASRIDEVLDIAERTAAKQAGMVAKIRAGQSVAEAMHDKNFAAVMEEHQQAERR